MNARRFRNPAFITALALLAVAAVGMDSAIRLSRIYLDKKPIYPRPIPGMAEGLTLLALPAETERWKRVGVDRVESAEIEEVLGTRNYVSRVYAEKAPPPGREPSRVDFHATYYTGMIDTVPHVPDRCFIGGGMRAGGIPRTLTLPLDQSGWRADYDVPDHLAGRIFTARSSSQGPGRGARVRLPRDPASIEMKVMEFLEKGSERPIFAGYFFIANGGTVARAEGVRLLAFNLSDDYAYYMKVQFTSDQVSSAEELAGVAASLLDDLFGDLMLCVPDWVDVESGLWPPDNPRRPAAPEARAQAAIPERR